jgi:hypothetical protein
MRLGTAIPASRRRLPFVYATHDEVIAQLVNLLNLTVAHGWWPEELDDFDERGSRIDVCPLTEWNAGMPESSRLEVAALPRRRLQLLPNPSRVR